MCAAAAAAKSLQSCQTLCDPIGGSPPSSPILGVLQARILEWVAISLSSAWKWKVKVKSLSRVWLLVTPWTAAYQALPSMGFSRQEYWSGVPLPSSMCVLVASIVSSSFNSIDYNPQGSSIHGILQARILEWVAIPFSRVSSLTQGLNPGILYCRWILYYLSHQGSPKQIYSNSGGQNSKINIMGGPGSFWRLSDQSIPLPLPVFTGCLHPLAYPAPLQPLVLLPPHCISIFFFKFSSPRLIFSLPLVGPLWFIRPPG